METIKKTPNEAYNAYVTLYEIDGYDDDLFINGCNELLINGYELTASQRKYFKIIYPELIEMYNIAYLTHIGVLRNEKINELLK